MTRYLKVRITIVTRKLQEIRILLHARKKHIKFPLTRIQRKDNNACSQILNMLTNILPMQLPKDEYLDKKNIKEALF